MKIKETDEFVNDKTGEQILCLGNRQDGDKGHLFGFFTQTNSPVDTFFGMRLSKIKKKNNWRRLSPLQGPMRGGSFTHPSDKNLGTVIRRCFGVS